MIRAIFPARWPVYPDLLEQAGYHVGDGDQGLPGIRRTIAGCIERLRHIRLDVSQALLIVGDADLWQPPALMRLFKHNIPNSELVIVPEAGHSVYWERPDAFNSAVLDFFGRHSR